MGNIDKELALQKQREANATAPVPVQDNLRTQIEKMTPEVMKALGEEDEIFAKQFIRQVITLVNSTPKLAECTTKSLLGAMMQSCQLKLQLNPALGTAYLIPRMNYKTQKMECQFQIGAGGYKELFYRHDQSISISAHTVHENDSFEFQYGTDQFLKHRPALDNPGKPIAYYAIAKLERSTEFEVMSHQAMLAHALQYSESADKKNGGFYKNSAWDKSFEGMAHTKVIKALAKDMPMSIESRKAISADGEVKYYDPKTGSLDTAPAPEVPEYSVSDPITEPEQAKEAEPVVEAPTESKQDDFDTRTCSECKKQGGHEAWCSYAPAPVKPAESDPETETETVPVIDTALNNEIIAVLRELWGIDDYEITHKRNSLALYLPSAFLAPESTDWESAIKNASIPEKEGKDAISYYKGRIPVARKIKKDKDAKLKAGKPSVDIKQLAKDEIYLLPSGEEKDECEKMLAEAEEQGIEGDSWQMIYDHARDAMDRLRALRAGK